MNKYKAVVKIIWAFVGVTTGIATAVAIPVSLIDSANELKEAFQEIIAS